MENEICLRFKKLPIDLKMNIYEFLLLCSECNKLITDCECVHCTICNSKFCNLEGKGCVYYRTRECIKCKNVVCLLCTNLRGNGFGCIRCYNN